MSQSNDEYLTEDVPSIEADTVEESHVEHREHDDDEEHSEAREEEHSEEPEDEPIDAQEEEEHSQAPEEETQVDHDDDDDSHAPADVESEPEEDTREASPPSAVDRYAEAGAEDEVEDEDADGPQPAAHTEETVESEAPVEAPPAHPADDDKDGAHSEDGSSNAAHDADAENERLFNMYQERLDSKPLGSARQASQHVSATRANATPRPRPPADSYARRGSSGLVRGNSLAGTPRQSVSGGDNATAFRRRASVLSSARYNAARASIGGASHYTVDRRRSSVPVTEGEQLALAKMEENEARRADARDRAALINAYREEDAVEMELQKEKAANERLLDRIHEKEQQHHARLRTNWERQEQARLRRESQEALRKEAIETRIATTREVTADPFKMMMAKRRYSANVVRSDQPVAPHRRITAGRSDNTLNEAPAERGTSTNSARAQRPGSAVGTPRSRRSSVQEARDMWRAPVAAAETKGKAWY